jgi:hypothetical protein
MAIADERRRASASAIIRRQGGILRISSIASTFGFSRRFRLLQRACVVVGWRTTLESDG